MIESSDRVDQFKADIAEMKVKDPSTTRDALLLRVGAVLMVAGIALLAFGYNKSHGTSDPLVQSDASILGMMGVAVTVIGAAMFLRYSIAQFLRFWLSRLVYEQRAQTDRIVNR